MIFTICATGFGAAAVWSGARIALGRAHHTRFTELRRPVGIAMSGGLRWRSVAAISGGAVLLDVFVSLVRVDPALFDAIDHAHGSGAFDSFEALRAHVSEVLDRGDLAARGLRAQYGGALGEILAAEHLRQAGHAVEFAPTPNQEGWDLLVDGHETQVKVGLDTGPIEAARAEHPDIDIVTVQEHGDTFAGTEVAILPLSGQDIADTTADSLDAITAVGDLALALPVIGGLIDVVLTRRAVDAGRMSREQGAANVVLKGVARASGFAGLLAAAKLCNRMASARQRTGGPRPQPARDTRLSRRERYLQAIDPLEELLEHDLANWRAAAALSARVAADDARIAADRCDVRPRWRDAIAPSRRLIVHRVAQRRFLREAAALDAIASTLEALETPRQIYAAWSRDMPQLGGLAPFDDALDARGAALRAVAKTYRQQPRRCWATRRRPRPPLTVHTPLPDAPKPPRWAYLASVTFIALTAGAAYAATLTSATQPPSKSHHAAAVLAPDTPAPPPAAPIETVTVDVDRCRLRAAPTTRSAIVGRAHRDETCALVEWRGNWARVRCDGTPGYMHRQCLVPNP